MQYKTIKTRGESKQKSMMKAELRFFALGEFSYVLMPSAVMPSAGWRNVNESQ